MMLAYQLAMNGVSVRVLERHPDFRREFRGELMQGSVVSQLEKAGLFQILLERGLALPHMKRQMFVGPTRQVRIPAPVETGAVVNQPGLLELLHEKCSALPNYQLDFGTAATEAILENGRVVAMKTKSGRVDGELFLVTNGRNSPLRKSCGLETETFESTADALWLRFDMSDAAASIPSTVNVHMFGKSVVLAVQPASFKRLHVAYSSAEDLNALKKDLPALKQRLLATGGSVLGPLMAQKLDEHTEMQVLKIIVDRVKPWHAPGILFLGDAAHTMSPSGGQGLNVAIRDTFVAANHLVPALQSGAPIDDALFKKIQDERQPEIEALQAGQTRAGQMALKPIGVLHLMFTMLGAAMTLMPGKFA
jgi:2-polyprenyl-6-methoxyphenol hydroxylase-like FAD-dependent oxidoreductase